MATYVPGIQEYIPQVQPFKPDFNFFQSALEMKQAQYQAGYNKISSLYGQLLNSDLLRDPNKKRRDTFFTEIDSDIKRLSGVDLSLVENQKEAMGLFQPLIDNDFFRKDLAYTKEYHNQLRKADALRTNPNSKSDERYWQEGVTALNYQAEDFSKASDNESLYFRNPRYTPYINGYEKLFQFAKDNNINPEGISFENGFIVKYTNGVQAIPSLQNIFSSALLSDPRIKEMFNTEAYLERKKYMKSNAEKFGGDEYAAETEYLTNKANEINEYYRKVSEQDQNTKNKISVTKKVIEDNVKTNGVDPDLDQGLVRLYQSLAKDDSIQNAVVEKNKEVTSQFEGIDVNALDRESLRNRIDGTYSYFLLDDLANKTAKSYAIGKAKYDIQVNPYQLESVKHRNRLIEKQVAFDYATKLKMMEIEGAILKELGNGVPGTSFGPLGSGGLFIPDPGGGNVSLSNMDIQEKNASQLQAYDQMGISGMYKNADTFLAYQNNIIKNSKDPAKIAKAEADILDYLGSYQVTEKAPEQKTTEFDWSEIALGAGELVGGSALAVVSGLGTLLSAGTATPLGAVGIGLGTTGVVSGASRLSSAWGGTETVTPEKITQTKGLVVKQTDGTYRLISKAEVATLTDPASSDYYFTVNDRLSKYANENLTINSKDPASRILKTQIDAYSEIVNKNKQVIEGIKEISKENNQVISTALAKEAGTNAQTANLYFNPDLTRARSLNEFTQAYINANKDDVDRYPRERMYGYQGSQIAKVSDEERMEDMRDDAEDLYENLTDAYAELKKNPDANLNIKGFGTALSSDEGLNRYFSGAAVYFFDPANFNDEPYQLLLDLYQKDLKPSLVNVVEKNRKNARVTFGSGFNITADEYASEDFQHNDKAANILNHLISTSFTKGIYKSEKRPRTELAFHAVAANDGNKVAVTFSPSPDYINEYAGTEKKQGATWALQQRMNEGKPTDITFFMDADKAQSLAFNRMQESSDEMLLSMYGKLDLNSFSDFGGNITLTPNASGGLSYTGIAKAVNEAGQIIENPIFGTTDAGINETASYFNQMLKGFSQTNLEMLEQMRLQSPNLEFNPEALLTTNEE